MKYAITTQGELTIIEVIGYNIFFGYDNSPEYDEFKNALSIKGIDVFVELLATNPNTAYSIFING